MGRGDWVPPEIDVNVPSIARVYDYFLGGSHNFAADRRAAENTLALVPNARLGFYEIRSFLRRAVEYLVGRGVTQFLDIGSGIPTAGNVHQIAQRADPEARIVYVDIDPIAVAHSRAILCDNARTAVIQADVREPERILADPRTLALLDFDKPVALLMCAILHFVPDTADPVGLVRRYRDALPAGSYLAISHATTDGQASTEPLTKWKAEYERGVTSMFPRPEAGIRAMFDGFDLVDPGLVWVSQWHADPGSQPAEFLTAYGAVGRKP